MYAALQIEPQGKVVAALAGRVPSYMQQAAVAAERYAMALAVLHSGVATRTSEQHTEALGAVGYPLSPSAVTCPAMCTDCLSLLYLEQHRSDMIGYKQKRAGLRLPMCDRLTGARLIHVRSHTSLNDAHSQWHRYLVLGSDAADRVAGLR